MDLNWILLTKVLIEAGIKLPKKDVEAIWSAMNLAGIAMAMDHATAVQNAAALSTAAPRSPAETASPGTSPLVVTIDVRAGSITFAMPG